MVSRVMEIPMVRTAMENPMVRTAMENPMVKTASDFIWNYTGVCISLFLVVLGWFMESDFVNKIGFISLCSFVYMYLRNDPTLSPKISSLEQTVKEQWRGLSDETATLVVAALGAASLLYMIS